ncbi:MAG: TrmJ/YjtD family RNA methyltransferase [Pseudolabrys sp.]
MAGSGTDKTKRWVEAPGPVVVLVEPQLGENIGAAARAMANFGLARLRLVNPKQSWPNDKAQVMAAGADRVLDRAELVASFDEAIADCSFVIACTARAHDQAKPVIGAGDAAALIAPKVAGGETVALVFGRERNGLESDEVARADVVLTRPVNPACASLNLAQAVAVTAYEWFKTAGGGKLPFLTPDKSPPAPKQQVAAFFHDLEIELDRIEFFRPHEKRGTMTINLRNIVNRMTPTEQDIRTLHGVLMALTHGRKGPARGGTLDGVQAEALRAVLAERDPLADQRPARGLARLLRRNPTETERVLWQALTNDKRFAGKGFQRQTPIGPHIVDFVSFPLKCVIDLVPAGENETVAQARDSKRIWLERHGYKVIIVTAATVEADVAKTLDALAGAISL